MELIGRAFMKFSAFLSTITKTMADQHSGEGSSTGNVSSMDSSDSNVLLNIKTLDSQIYSFQVDKNVRNIFVRSLNLVVVGTCFNRIGLICELKLLNATYFNRIGLICALKLLNFYRFCFMLFEYELTC